MNDLRSQLSVSSLISAYDTHHNYVDKEVGLSDMVIIDSGNYEKRVLEGLGCSVNWTRDQQSNAIDSLIPLTKVAIVNYDEPAPLKDQVDSAKSLFARHPKYAKDSL